MVGVLPTLVGISPYTAASPGILTNFTLPMPDGTQVGDLQVASIMTLNGTMIDPSGDFTPLWRSSVDGGVYGAWDYGVWVRYWDGDTTPISWRGEGFATGPGQFFGAFLATFRNRLDDSRPLTRTDGPTVPGLPGKGPAVCITWSRPIDPPPAPFGGTDWAATYQLNGSFVFADIGLHADTVADQASTYADTNPYMSFGLFGRVIAPPCRIHPREDQLGVGSGRVWPPPKSHQASPRRAGGYY